MSNTAIGLSLVAYIALTTALHIHGIVLCFKKKWYFGVMAVVIPWFATMVSLAKIFLKKDILE